MPITPSGVHRKTVNRENKYWLTAISAVVVVVGIAVYVNQRNQEQRTFEDQSQALQNLANRQDQANRDEMGRQLSESELRNELDSAARREAALQAQLTAIDTANQNRTADAQQLAKRQQAERELEDLRAQRAQLQKQVNCARIQLSMNQLTAQGDTDQALSVQKQWAVPCPNLQVGG